MRKYFWAKYFTMIKIYAFCFLILAFAACTSYNDISLEAGESFTNSDVKVLSIDTMTVDFSTFTFDSVPFTSASRLLIGNYNDPVFGKTTAAPFMEFSPSSYSINSEGVYDSIVLIMGYDNYYYNDTLTSMTYNVHKVTKRIKPIEDDSFYNTNTFSYNPTVLGSLTFTPKPIGKDSIRITLSNDFGLDLFTKIQDKDITDLDLLREQFKGLTVQSVANDNGSIIGYEPNNTKTILRFYFSVPEDVSEDEQHYDMTINVTSDPSSYFNNVVSDRTGTVLQSLTGQDDLYSSTVLNNQSYAQAGVGVANKIRIPHLKTLLELGGDGTVLDATLKIYVDQNNYSKKLFLNDSLDVYYIDRHQNLTSNLIGYGENNIVATVNYEEEYGETYYTVPLTVFLDTVLGSSSDDDLSLTLLPTDYAVTLNRVIFNNSLSTSRKPELIITYAIYNDED